MAWTPSDFSIETIKPTPGKTGDPFEFIIEGNDIPENVCVQFQSGPTVVDATDVTVPCSTEIKGTVQLEKSGNYTIVVFEHGIEDVASYITNFPVLEG